MERLQLFKVLFRTLFLCQQSTRGSGSSGWRNAGLSNGFSGPIRGGCPISGGPVQFYSNVTPFPYPSCGSGGVDQLLVYSFGITLDWVFPDCGQRAGREALLLLGRPVPCLSLSPQTILVLLSKSGAPKKSRPCIVTNNKCGSTCASLCILCATAILLPVYVVVCHSVQPSPALVAAICCHASHT